VQPVLSQFSDLKRHRRRVAVVKTMKRARPEVQLSGHSDADTQTGRDYHPETGQGGPVPVQTDVKRVSSFSQAGADKAKWPCRRAILKATPQSGTV